MDVDEGVRRGLDGDGRQQGGQQGQQQGQQGQQGDPGRLLGAGTSPLLVRQISLVTKTYLGKPSTTKSDGNDIEDNFFHNFDSNSALHLKCFYCNALIEPSNWVPVIVLAHRICKTKKTDFLENV